MNEQEVKEFIGKDNWKEFCVFIYGQTIGIDDEGNNDYYKWDVERFKDGRQRFW